MRMNCGMILIISAIIKKKKIADKGLRTAPA